MLALNIHGTLTENLFEVVLAMFSDAISDLQEIDKTLDINDTNELFSLALEHAGTEMMENAAYASIKSIWSEKEARVIYILNKNYHSDMTLAACRSLIETTFQQQESYTYRDYTEQDYQQVSNLFKHYLKDAISSHPALASKLCINSVISIEEQVQGLCRKIDEMQLCQKSLQLISKETRRHKNSFHKESREAELEKIQSLLRENEKVCVVSGIGGIGKTELCKYLFHHYMNGHAPSEVLYIGWITYHGNLVQTLYDQIVCPKDSSDILHGYHQTCAYLQSLGTHLLLFVDNISQTAAYDPEISFLWNLNCRMVITSRINTLDTVPPMILGPLSVKWSTCLFYTFYHGKKDSTSLQRIFSLTSRHPLAIELIAKTAQATGLTVAQIAVQLETSGFTLPDCRKKVWFDNDQEELIDHFCKLFQMASLPPIYVKILHRLSLLPAKAYQLDQLMKWDIVSERDRLEVLALRGWISFEGNQVSIHPVISDAVHRKISHRYLNYKSMYRALVAALEYNTTSFFPEKYFLALDCFYVIHRLGFEKLEYAQLLHQIATVFNRAGRYDSSYTLLKKSIRIKLKLHAATESLFSSYNNISLSCKNMARQQGNHNKLIEALQWAQDAECLGRELYFQDPSEYALKYAVTMNNLALCQFNLGQLAEAEQSLLASIHLKIEAHGENCIELGQSYNNLALIYKRRGVEEHNQAHIAQALQIQQLAVKYKEDIDYPIHLFNLASIEYLMKDYPSAKEHLETVISIWSKNEEIYQDKLEMAQEQYHKVCATLDR